MVGARNKARSSGRAFSRLKCWPFSSRRGIVLVDDEAGSEQHSSPIRQRHTTGLKSAHCEELCKRLNLLYCPEKVTQRPTRAAFGLVKVYMRKTKLPETLHNHASRIQEKLHGALQRYDYAVFSLTSGIFAFCIIPGLQLWLAGSSLEPLLTT